jgi:hypothetical protein
MTVRGRYKLYRIHGGPSMKGTAFGDAFELYDLEQDPGETTDLFPTASDDEAHAVKSSFCEHFWRHAGAMGCGLETRRRLLGDAGAEAFLAQYRPDGDLGR